MPTIRPLNTPSLAVYKATGTPVLPSRPSSVILRASSDNKLDRVLSDLTSAFPLFVLGSAVVATISPPVFQWVNRGSIISAMLAAVMCGTGLTLEKSDFTNVLEKNAWIVPLGVACQFGIMPLSAKLVGTTLLGGVTPADRALFLGLVLVGCSPGGTASNLVSLIAKADVALSVLLTTCSTLLAVVVTPLLVKLLVGSNIAVSGLALCAATAKVVLLPVLLGMLFKSKAPAFADASARFTPFASVVLVALICGGVVAENARLVLDGTSSAGLLLKIVGSVVALHSIGFGVGYLVPKALGCTEQSSRTISIETGMQNSALAIVLAKSLGAHPLASLPGALSATVHSCLGSMLAAVWRRPRPLEPALPGPDHVPDFKGDEPEFSI